MKTDATGWRCDFCIDQQTRYTEARHNGDPPPLPDGWITVVASSDRCGPLKLTLCENHAAAGRMLSCFIPSAKTFSFDQEP